MLLIIYANVCVFDGLTSFVEMVFLIDKQPVSIIEHCLFLSFRVNRGQSATLLLRIVASTGYELVLPKIKAE
ncbi:hypothetical protein DIU36_00940 [Mucilaginibacter rubeus]|nr:hypothetical protein DIU36_00940 [Mucilaginibacter rubeus]